MELTSSTPLKGKSQQYILSGATIDSVQQSFTNIFAELGYKQQSTDWQKTVFSKGKRWLRLLLGVFIKYNKVEVSFSNAGDMVTAVVTNASSGFSGGVIGMVQTSKEFKKIVATLDERLGTSIY